MTVGDLNFTLIMIKLNVKLRLEYACIHSKRTKIKKRKKERKRRNCAIGQSESPKINVLKQTWQSFLKRRKIRETS